MSSLNNLNPGKYFGNIAEAEIEFLIKWLGPKDLGQYSSANSEQHIHKSKPLFN